LGKKGSTHLTRGLCRFEQGYSALIDNPLKLKKSPSSNIKPPFLLSHLLLSSTIPYAHSFIILVYVVTAPPPIVGPCLLFWWLSSSIHGFLLIIFRFSFVFRHFIRHYSSPFIVSSLCLCHWWLFFRYESLLIRDCSISSLCSLHSSTYLCIPTSVLHPYLRFYSNSSINNLQDSAKRTSEAREEAKYEKIQESYF